MAALNSMSTYGPVDPSWQTYDGQRVWNFGLLEPHFGSVINWNYLFFLFKNISPYFWTGLGVALCVGLSVAGAAW